MGVWFAGVSCLFQGGIRRACSSFANRGQKCGVTLLKLELGGISTVRYGRSGWILVVVLMVP